MSNFQYDIDHEIGENNVSLWGMDIHNPVFFVSAILIIVFVVATLIVPGEASLILGGARSWTLEHAHWLFSSGIAVILLFCVMLAVLPYGRIRLGGPTATPAFSTWSWLAMLFSAGVGIGLMFWGAAEPLAYFTGWSGTPLGVEPGTPEARKLAMSATIFHWGLHPWAVYALMGLALAFFAFNKGLPLTIRSTFYPLLGERVWGWPGHIIDCLAVIATLFGLATSLGFGALQASSGLHFLFGIDAGITTQIGIIVGVTSMAILSVIRGLDRGIKVLSNLNIVLAIGLLAFVLVFVYFTWKKRKEEKSYRIMPILDLLSPYVGLGLAIHRAFGCFLNGCCYGRPTDMPWGVQFPLDHQGIGSSSSDRAPAIFRSGNMSADHRTYRSIRTIYLHGAVEGMTQTLSNSRTDQ